MSDKHDLDDKLINEFTSKIEKAINKVCDNAAEKDPRRELIVVLALLTCQVAFDGELSKDKFLKFMAETYDDFSEAADVTEELDTNVYTNKDPKYSIN